LVTVVDVECVPGRPAMPISITSLNMMPAGAACISAARAREPERTQRTWARAVDGDGGIFARLVPCDPCGDSPSAQRTRRRGGRTRRHAHVASELLMALYVKLSGICSGVNCFAGTVVRLMCPVAIGRELARS
jgi:hypothetical protein